MRILVLLDNAANGSDIQVPDDVIVEVCADTQTMTTRLVNLEPGFDVVIVSPDSPSPALRDAVADCPAFTVEVQPENISGTDRHSANADAELFGLGSAGIAHACALLEARQS